MISPYFFTQIIVNLKTLIKTKNPRCSGGFRFAFCDTMSLFSPLLLYHSNKEIATALKKLFTLPTGRKHLSAKFLPLSSDYAIIISLPSPILVTEGRCFDAVFANSVCRCYGQCNFVLHSQMVE